MISEYKNDDCVKRLKLFGVVARSAVTLIAAHKLNPEPIEVENDDVREAIEVAELASSACRCKKTARIKL